MKTKCCASCWFSSKDNVMQPPEDIRKAMQDPDGIEQEEQSYIYECRRSPPTIVIQKEEYEESPHLWHFPLLYGRQKCGEWKKASEETD